MHTEINSHLINYEFIYPGSSENECLIVFLHEGLGSIAQWKNFPAEICQQLNLTGLVYERYGHGKSAKLEGKRNPDYMHVEAWQELPELLKKLGIRQKIILIGHSDGASISLLYGARYPEKVIGIVSIAAHVMVEACTVAGVKNTIRLYEDFDLKYLLEKYHGENTDTMFYGWAEAWTSTEFQTWDIRKDIRELTSPVLIIQGENDEYATIAQVDEIAGNIKGTFKKLIVPGSGHQPHLQQKDFVRGEIINFLKIILQKKD